MTPINEAGIFRPQLRNSDIICATVISLRFNQIFFEISAYLQQLFERTKLTDIDPAAAKMPYPCFYVTVPNSGLKLWGGPSGWHDLAGFYVRKGNLHGKDLLFFLLWGPENSSSAMAGDDASTWFNIDIEIFDHF